MKKVMKLTGLMLVALMATVIWRGNVSARITGTPPTSADTFCVGPSALEVCVDASANLIPTTTGVGSLGSSTLQWNNLTMSGTFTGVGATSLGAVGTNNTPGTGISAFGTVSTIIGPLVLQKVAIGTNGGGPANKVAVSSTIPYLGTFETILATGTGNIVLTSVPTISTTTVFGTSTAVTDGSILILTSTSATSGVVVQDNDTLSGSGLQLGAATRVISANKTLTLIFNAGTGFWNELAYSSN